MRSLLRCPICLSPFPQEYTCPSGHRFTWRDAFLDLAYFPEPLPERYSEPDYVKWRAVSAAELKNTYRPRSAAARIQNQAHAFLERMAEGEMRSPKLDLGCGFGAHLDMAKNTGEWIGLDLNETSLTAASQAHPGAFFVRANMECLPFAEGVFGTIAAVFSLEHVCRLDKVISEMDRVLAPGGSVLVGLPCEGEWLHDLVRSCTTVPYYSLKYRLSYPKVIAVEHCNSARRVLSALERTFSPSKRRFLPWDSGFSTSFVVLTSYRKNGGAR